MRRRHRLEKKVNIKLAYQSFFTMRKFYFFSNELILNVQYLKITLCVYIFYFAEFLLLDRFDNILGTKTIDSLVYLSSEIKSIFCHPTMVDRIAAMLNYFLLHLVGPNKKNFKVSSTCAQTTFKLIGKE